MTLDQKNELLQLLREIVKLHEDTEYLDVKGIDYYQIRLRALLAQLDWEQLENLLNIIKDSYDEGQSSW